jgi:Tfp pilus assembly protein PilZ
MPAGGPLLAVGLASGDGGGLVAHVNRPLRPGDRVLIELFLPAVEEVVRLGAAVEWCTPTGVGLFHAGLRLAALGIPDGPADQRGSR